MPDRLRQDDRSHHRSSKAAIPQIKDKKINRDTEKIQALQDGDCKQPECLYGADARLGPNRIHSLFLPLRERKQDMQRLQEAVLIRQQVRHLPA